MLAYIKNKARKLFVLAPDITSKKINKNNDTKEYIFFVFQKRTVVAQRFIKSTPLILNWLLIVFTKMPFNCLL